MKWPKSGKFIPFVLLFAFAGFFLSKITFNNSPYVFIPEGTPGSKLTAQMRQYFPEDAIALVLFEGPEIWTPQFLRNLESAVEEVKAIEGVDDVHSVIDHVEIRATKDGFHVRPLLADLLEGDDERASVVEEIKRRVKEDPFLKGRLVSTTEDAYAVVVRLRESNKSSFLNTQIWDRVMSIFQSRVGENVAGASGHVPIEVAESKEIFERTPVIATLSTIIGLLMVTWFFRGWRLLFVTGLNILSVNVAVVSLYGLFGWPYNSIASITFPLMTASTTALLVHLLNTARYFSVKGYSGDELLKVSTNYVKVAAFYTSLTTAIGLLSLSFNQIRPIHQFGLINAIGIMFCMAFVVFVGFPATFKTVENTLSGPSNKKSGPMDHFIMKTVFFSINRPKFVVGVFAVITLITLSLIPMIKVETSLFEFFKEDHPIRISDAKLERALGGTAPLSLSFMTNETDSFLNPSYLQLIEDFQRWAEEQPEVASTVGASNFMKEINWAFHGEKSNERRLPQSAELISQYRLMYDDDDLYDYIDKDWSVSQVLLMLNIHGANEISDFISRAKNYLRERLPENISAEFWGISRMFADQEDLLVEGQGKSVISAALLIWFVLFVLWRRWKLAFIAMLPNVAPALSMFATMALLGIWLDFATAMIASIVVGISVDDTIHLFQSYLDGRARSMNVKEAIEHAYTLSGRAVTLTTVILCLQFMSLTISDYVPLIRFGLLTSIGLAFAWVFDVVLTPALLVLYDGKPSPR